MQLITLLIIPLMGVFIIYASMSYELPLDLSTNLWLKKIALFTTIINLIVALIIFISFEYSSIQFQFVQEKYTTSYYDFYLGVDGISIYFVLLTTIITPIALLSN